MDYMLKYTGEEFSVIEMFLKNEDERASCLFEFVITRDAKWLKEKGKLYVPDTLTFEYRPQHAQLFSF